ncbi:ricin-agglutinin family protein [Ricinus communis]|uniref:rRNA N-glycosylase n=1 Tax=Ricinus communis TaxID=3988 RepID=B9SBQ1_RICCO|nr:ricin-agglutinin family protein [Ricinus communis]
MDAKDHIFLILQHGSGSHSNGSMVYLLDSYYYSYDRYSYTNFIDGLRGLLAEGGSVSHSIPVLPTQVPADDDSRFVLAVLEKVGHYTTLALDGTNANIVGFSIETDSYFFKDVADNIYASPLFDNTYKTRLPFGSSYDSLEAEGAYRENTTLGTYPLNDAASKLYAYHSNNTIDIAPSLLVIIQMVSEAARFQYIEGMLFDNFNVGLDPKCDMLSLEDNWYVISIAIQTSVNDKFLFPVQLQQEDCSTEKVSNVGVVQSKMGLLWPFPCQGDLIRKLSSVV